MHRALPRGRPRHRAREAEALGGGGETGAVVGMDHRQDEVHLGVVGEHPQAFAHHRRAAQHLVLLGIVQPGARPAPGCDHHRGDADVP